MNDSRIAPVFQILAEDIHALGVRTVFGLMSDDTAVFNADIAAPFMGEFAEFEARQHG